MTDHNTRYCTHCGAALRDGVIYEKCPGCGTEIIRLDKRFCPECGKQNITMTHGERNGMCIREWYRCNNCDTIFMIEQYCNRSHQEKMFNDKTRCLK